MLTRTTVDLPAALVSELKARAAEQGETLRQLLTRSIEAELGHVRSNRSSPPRRVKPPLIRHRGGPKLRVTKQLKARLEAEDNLDRCVWSIHGG
jgi:hypothetical protein